MNIWHEQEQTAGVTYTEIVAVEQALGVKLPKSYIEQLKYHNGGTLRYTSYNNEALAEPLLIDFMYGTAGSPSLKDTPELIEDYHLEHHIVIFAGDGDEWFAFDYREDTAEPAVLVFTADEDIIELAPSFDAFVKGLGHDGEQFMEDDDGDVEDDGEMPIYDIKEQLNNAESADELREALEAATHYMQHNPDDEADVYFVGELLDVARYASHEAHQFVPHYLKLWERQTIITSSQVAKCIERLKEQQLWSDAMQQIYEA
ncbi:SMI1/KNR4 family protein [Kurthia huakuii]|uniref:SMI1/KNR4 family protein n=1 Tax=Kurthia huakuii TaxID=1421019 RepID=UPI0004965E87|nr:SMI1/KNR4 family protein [Kurthia huakuii]MBM7700136.1 hypothetical protein [Kurthia huakuii]